MQPIGWMTENSGLSCIQLVPFCCSAIVTKQMGAGYGDAAASDRHAASAYKSWRHEQHLGIQNSLGVAIGLQSDV